MLLWELWGYIWETWNVINPVDEYEWSCVNCYEFSARAPLWNMGLQYGRGTGRLFNRMLAIHGWRNKEGMYSRCCSFLLSSVIAYPAFTVSSIVTGPPHLLPLPPFPMSAVKTTTVQLAFYWPSKNLKNAFNAILWSTVPVVDLRVIVSTIQHLPSRV